MAMRGGPSLLPVGSAAWIAEERATAMDMTRAEIEEHSFSVRNDMDWLNEHMAEIFSENQMCVFLNSGIVQQANQGRNVAEFFKTPGKLRGKTPRTAKKTTASGEARVVSFARLPKPNTIPLLTISSHSRMCSLPHQRAPPIHSRCPSPTQAEHNLLAFR